MFWAAGPVMAAVLAADGWWLVGGILWVVLIVAGAWAGTWRWWTGALFLSLCAGILHGVRLERQQENARTALQSHLGVELEGVVLNEPEQNGESWSALVRVTRCAGEGKAFGGRVWWEGRGETPRQGSLVTARGRVVAPSAPRNPGEFDMSGWLHRQGTDLMFRARYGTQSVRTGWLARVATDTRASFREAITCGLEADGREARVIRAMVLGDMPRDDDMLIDAFRQSGSLHFFVVSGQRVFMVQIFLWFILGWCGVPRRTAIWLLIPAGFAYCWLTGMRPPASRAAWMSAVYLGGFLARRRPDALNTLGVTLAGCLLWDGHDLFLPGVQLSYAVVGVMSSLAGVYGRLAARLVRREPYLPVALAGRWSERWLAARRTVVGAVGVSGAAWAGSAPLCAWHFGLFTPVSVVATLFLGPTGSALLCVSLASAMIWPVAPGVAARVNRVNGLLAQACVAMAEWFASVPGGHAATGGWSDSEYPHLIVYDLPRGGVASCFATRDGGVLIDTGDRLGFRRVVLPSVRSFGILPDAVVISQPDGGHFGAGAEVFDSLPVRQVLLPVEESRSPAMQSWLQGARTAGAAIMQARPDARFPLVGGATLQVVHAPDPALVRASADERVAVFLLQCNGWRVLLTSGAGTAVERAMLRDGADLRADVIVAGRNRRDRSLGPDFLDAVRPRAVVATHADFPEQERIPGELIADLQRRGVPLFHQGQTGAVTLCFRPEALEIKGFINAQTLRIPRP